MDGEEEGDILERSVSLQRKRKAHRKMPVRFSFGLDEDAGTAVIFLSGGAMRVVCWCGLDDQNIQNVSIRKTLIVMTPETTIPFHTPSAMAMAVLRYLFRLSYSMLFILLLRRMIIFQMSCANRSCRCQLFLSGLV